MSLKIGWSVVWVSPELFTVADPPCGGAGGAASQGPRPAVCSVQGVDKHTEPETENTFQKSANGCA